MENKLNIAELERPGVEKAHSLESNPIPSDRIKKLEQTLVRGAWVRSGSSLIMWFFALAAYLLQVIDFSVFLGITLSVLYLVLINPPTLWIFRLIKHKKHPEYFSLIINGLEVIGYTAIIYFLGGLNVSYMILIYTLLIIYVGVLSPSYWPLFVTAYCSLSFTGMVLLIYYRIIPTPSNYLNHFLPLTRQLFDVLIITAFLLLVSLISSYTSQTIRKGRKQLKKQNLALIDSMDKLEQAGRILQEKNRALREALADKEKAQSSDRLKSQFLANMSHELRTPLNHIIGFNELVLSKNFGDLNPVQEDFLTDVLTSSHHLLSLINSILDLAKVEAGKMELELSVFHLQPFLEKSLIMVREEAYKHQISLQTDFGDLPDRIRADERKLKQILYNLLSNAVKFTPDGGPVRLSASRVQDSASGSEGPENPEPGVRMEQEISLKLQTQPSELCGDFIKISISDRGIGLRAEDLERIFKPFEQADNSGSRKYQGTGLGLSLTKRLVELHGGKIWANSKGLGQGAGFHFTLPIRSQEIGD